MTTYRVHEIINYGGFFGGDSVTFTASALDGPSGEQTFTIDQSLLTNVGNDRYKIVSGLALELETEGDHVASAKVVGAQDRVLLRRTLVVADEPFDAPRLFAHYCKQCQLWILGVPEEGKCRIARHAL